MPRKIDEIREKLKKNFTIRNMTTADKIAYAIGYFEDNEKVTKKTALELIYEILMEKF